MKTGKQLGDIFTKALTRTQVNYLYNNLGIINIYAPTYEDVMECTTIHRIVT